MLPLSAALESSTSAAPRGDRARARPGSRAAGLGLGRRLAPAAAQGRHQGSRWRRHVQASDKAELLPDFVLVPWDASSETWDEEAEARMSELISRFKAADKDGNGVIDKEELRSLLERVGGGEDQVPVSWLTESDVDEVMEQYDTNKDGVISFDEYSRMAHDKIFLTGKLQEYRDAFRAVDSGGNGTISATELYQLFEKIGNPVSYQKLVKIMEQYDVDQSGVLDFGEFLRMFRGELLDLEDILAYIKKRSAGWQAAQEAKKAAAEAKAAAKAEAAAAAAAAAALPAEAPLEAAEALAAATPAPAPAPAPAKGEAGPKLLPGGVNLLFSEADLDAVLTAHPDTLIVVMASVTWCRPCKAFQEKYEKAALHYRSAIFLKFYGNSNESTKQLFKERLKARTTPSFFMFKGGQLVGSCTGAVATRLESNIRTAYGPGMPAEEPLWPEEVSSSSDSNGNSNGKA